MIKENCILVLIIIIHTLRDFAYVARDRNTRKHMCHVFRCDTPARQIANTLRDICQRIMLERSAKPIPQMAAQRPGISRPTNLPNLEKLGLGGPDGQKITFESLYKSELECDLVSPTGVRSRREALGVKPCQVL